MRGTGSLLPAAVALGGLLLAVAGGYPADPPGKGSTQGAPLPEEESCARCHAGIEEMHPWYELSCTACHGGDPAATTESGAHVGPRRPPPVDERLLPLDFDPAYVQFLNPSDLRVAARTCGQCHTLEVENVLKSMHGTTAGHLSDSLYENGLTGERRVRYAIFPVEDRDGEVPELGYERMPAYRTSWDPGQRDSLAGHVADLGRKNCMQCHLWSSGTAVRGRLGQDGNYRAAGCAACHVEYADDGLSKSRDPTVDPFEPGHPLAHRMTASPTTQTCTRCHFGDASIGLHFRGLAQLVPGMPAGPEVPGTTDALLNGAYYINDPSIVPPDVHHEKGMHCIDCHTFQDVMGDGNIYGFMEHAVEIECTDCHGTFTTPSSLTSSRGTPLKHLHRDEDGRVYLVSRVDGRRHWVKQAADVINPERPEYNARAARAMTHEHSRMECYACHAGWSVNFFGFHFDRNESFTDLDLLLGKRTPGRCTTQEKVFATLKHLYLGFNDEGMIAPYLVGFSTMGTVHDESGEVFLDQELPVTAAGLSGMTMIAHQLHSTRGTARQCIECHRSPATLGLGTGSFKLSREFAAVTDDLGLHLVAVDRKNPELSVAVSRVALAGAGRLAARCDELQGRFETIYVALDSGGVAVIDARDPLFPRRLRVLETEDARDLQLRASWLFVADGAAGLKIFDVSRADRPRQIAQVQSAEARSVEVSWPHAYLADGPGGVKVIDVRDPRRPDFIAHWDVNERPERPDDVSSVRTLFQYSRPDDGQGQRTRARMLAVVSAGQDGFVLYDASEPAQPRRLYPPSRTPLVTARPTDGRVEFCDAVLLSRFDLGSQGGDIPTVEHDYAYLVARERQRGAGSVWIVQVTDPTSPRRVGIARLNDAAESLALASYYNPPFLQRFLAVATSDGADVVDISRSEQPKVLGQLFTAGRPARGVVFEEFSLDRMIDESGRQLKDISHEPSRYLNAQEVERVLTAPLDEDVLEDLDR